MIQSILDQYDELYTDLLYREVNELINNLTDREFEELCSNNATLLSPISQRGGTQYLKRKSTLLEIRQKIIDLVKVEFPPKIDDLFKV